VTGTMPLRHQDLDPLPDDLGRRPPEDLLRAAIEERDALEIIHADDGIRCDPNDLSENVVGYSIGHAV
jgi:hypothetical protein